MRELERRAGLPIHLSVSEALPEPVPVEQGVALYHIAQEGLHNALRHARATSIKVGLDVRAGCLVLTVPDDGVGIPPSRVIVRRASLLSPIWRIESGRGPIKLRRDASHRAAKVAFSDRQPQPGWMAPTGRRS